MPFQKDTIRQMLLPEGGLPPKRHKRGQPTIMQIKALQYMNQGYSKRQSMLKAGYSNAAATHPKAAFFSKRGVQIATRDMDLELMKVGLTPPYIAEKFKEWFSATQIKSSLTEPDKEVPDYKTQLDAYKEWKKIFDQKEGISVREKGVTRKLTIEEFVSGDEKEGV